MGKSKWQTCWCLNSQSWGTCRWLSFFFLVGDKVVAQVWINMLAPSWTRKCWTLNPNATGKWFFAPWTGQLNQRVTLHCSSLPPIPRNLQQDGWEGCSDTNPSLFSLLVNPIHLGWKGWLSWTLPFFHVRWCDVGKAQLARSFSTNKGVCRTSPCDGPALL